MITIRKIDEVAKKTFDISRCALLRILPRMDSHAARRRIRAGEWTGPTSGMAISHVQGNVVILPREFAPEFMQYCHGNPKPCPVLAISQPGDPSLPTLGGDIDIRTDVPRFRVFENGACVDEPYDIKRWWRQDLVTFILGCSHSFEAALLDAGLRLKHIECSSTVPMYRTNLETQATGRFRGPLVVSMRPYAPADAIRAVQVTSRFPAVHGAPVHLGLPLAIGIRDLMRPDFGDPVEVHDGELPVFWACGVTPQAVIENAKLPLCITHYPGAMLITDLLNARISIL